MQTDRLSNPQLVTIAVALIGGDVDYVDPEDIAIKVDELAPARFGWRKYPDRIDLDSVRVAMRDAKKPKNGGLLIGSNSDGWILSPAGLKWIEALDMADLQVRRQVQNRRDSIAANLEAERARLRLSQAYSLFVNDQKDALTLQHFHQFARVNEYFGEKALQRRCIIVSNAVAGDEILSELWAILKIRFYKEMLSDVNSQTD